MAQKNGQLRAGVSAGFRKPWNSPIPAHSIKTEIQFPKILIALHSTDTV
jgi:hypothetical protein